MFAFYKILRHIYLTYPTVWSHLIMKQRISGIHQYHVCWYSVACVLQLLTPKNCFLVCRRDGLGQKRDGELQRVSICFHPLGRSRGHRGWRWRRRCLIWRFPVFLLLILQAEAQAFHGLKLKLQNDHQLHYMLVSFIHNKQVDRSVGWLS